MGNIIQSGGIGNYKGLVNSEGRQYVDAVSEDRSVQSNLIGNAYNINTGNITLTNAVETPLIYFKNNEDLDFVIELVVIGMGPSTDGTGSKVEVTFIRNPVTGTIISSTPTDVDIVSNRNYGSKRTLTADVYKGATGDTMTDGDDHIFIYINGSTTATSRTPVPINEIIPKGSSFGLKLTPLASNTSTDVYVAIVGYLKAEEKT